MYAELLYGGYDDLDAIRENSAAMSLAYETGRRLATVSSQPADQVQISKDNDE